MGTVPVSRLWDGPDVGAVARITKFGGPDLEALESRCAAPPVEMPPNEVSRIVLSAQLG